MTFFEDSYIQQREWYGYVKDSKEGKGDVCERLALELLVQLDHVHARGDGKDQVVEDVRQLTILDKEGQRENQYAYESTKPLLWYQSIKSNQLIELQQRHQADNKENNEVRPLAEAYTRNDKGSTQNTRNDPLRKVIVFGDCCQIGWV